MQHHTFRRLAPLLVYLAISGICLGQSRTFIGLKGGGNLSTVYLEHTIYTTLVNTTVVPGYNAGLMVKHFSTKKPTFLNAGIQGGLTFIEKGWAQVFPTDEPNYEVKMRYVELPLEATVYAGKKKTKLFFTLGMYLEYLTSVAKDADPNLDSIGQSEFYTYHKGRDNKFGYGTRGSIGIHHDFPFGAIHLDGFFAFSFSNILDYGEFDSRVPDLSNHIVFGFTVAYLIPFGKLDF